MKPAYFLWNNPIIIKEIRTRMRGKRAFILITAHLLCLAAAVGLTYLVMLTSMPAQNSLSDRQVFGKVLFWVVILIELVMVSFIAPALTGGAISSERERQTFDLIKVTRLSASKLVTGKYLSGLGFIFLLLFTSLPIQGPAFTIGGTVWQEIALATAIVLVTAIMFCALALLLSCLNRRPMMSAAIAYAITIFLTFGIPIIALIFIITFENLLGNFKSISLTLQTILLTTGWVIICITPIGTIVSTEIIFENYDSFLGAQINLRDNSQVFLPSPWIPFVIFYLLLSLIAIWVSIQIVKHPEN